MTWEKEYRDKVREFMAKNGEPMDLQEPRFGDGPPEPDFYGWIDYEAKWHILGGYRQKETGCSWVVPEGSVLTESSFYQFSDTFHDPDYVHCVQVAGAHCACGQLKDMTLGWTGTVAEMLHSILDIPDAQLEVVL